MGQRTVYYQSRNGNSLRNHLQTDYINFRQWLLKENNNCIQEFDERLISNKLEFFLNKNDFLSDLQNTPQEIIDDLTLEYLTTYIDYGTEKDKFEVIGPMMGTWRYNHFRELVSKIDDIELQTICSIFDNGKSLCNDEPFTPNKYNNKIGFWTIDEQRVLEKKLKEKKNLLDKTEGYEYLISVLEEAKDRNQELIIDIEK